ncbi:MAG: thiamine diphosphokinase [Acidimicrobiia bacterium]|nr:thiamine diphosphokinase [Acidimicrobiia bacterium]
MENSEEARALIVAGGRPVRPAVLNRVAEPAWIVAADSGLDHAYDLGLEPNLVIGDMDSVSAAGLARAQAAGIQIERYPVDKYATDLELAIGAAVAAGFAEATIIGGTGGRLSHTLANALVLTVDRGIRLDWLTSHARICALHAGQTGTFHPAEGTILSLVPVAGRAVCSSVGLRWPLAQAELSPGSTRGISNEIVAADGATVSVTAGCVLLIQERNQP